MLTALGLTRSARLATLVVLLAMKSTLSPGVLPLLLCGKRYANLFTFPTDTMRSLFPQQDHLGVCHYILALGVMQM